MRNLSIVLSIIFCMAIVYDASAQLSKQEKKEWKKKAKELSKDPEKLKNIYDEYSTMKSEAENYKRQITSLEGKLKDKDARISELTQQLRTMEAEVANAKKLVEEAKQAPPPKQTDAPVWDDSGVVFKVQIGAFRNKDLSKYFDNTENFSGETDEDGVQKITLGRFRDYWESDTFKKYLREMGVNDAWIVPYKDGKRVAMKDVLEGVI